MESKKLKELWGGIAIAAGIAVVIALIAAPEQIAKWSVVTLVILGAIFFYGGFYLLNWPKGKAQFVGLNILACLVCATLGWAVWPLPRHDDPVVNASLIIDDVGDRDISFHFQLETPVGSPEIKNILQRLTTEDAIQREFIAPKEKDLQSGGRLTIVPPPFFLTVREYNSVLFVITYRADIRGVPREYTSTYHFFFGREQTEKGSVIDPYSTSQEEVKTR